MTRDLRDVVRTFQTEFPELIELKFAVQRTFRQALRRPFDKDFELLRALPGQAGKDWLDVGANRGQSIDAMRLFNSKGNIVAFEPNPVLAARLTKRFAHDRAIVIRTTGLGDAEGDFNLHIPVYGSWEFDGLASFDAASAREWLSTRLIGFNPSRLRLNTYSCSISRLDDFSLRPSFIKVDVQGYEARVLLGAERTISEHKPILLVEAGDDWKSPPFIVDLGYESYSYQHRTLTVSEISGRNTFFLCPESIELLDRTKVKIM